MPLDIVTLANGTLAQATDLAAAHLLYKPTTTVPKKTAIVHVIRLTNIATSVVKIRVFFLKNGGTIGGENPDERRILPKDLAVPPGFTVIDDDQTTLDSGDGIYAFADTASAVDFTLSGSERPA